jgi:hypothetical protein
MTTETVSVQVSKETEIFSYREELLRKFSDLHINMISQLTTCLCLLLPLPMTTFTFCLLNELM